MAGSFHFEAASRSSPHRSLPVHRRVSTLRFFFKITLGRADIVLTEKGRDFFPAYLALKKWGDDWLAEPAGPQVVFRERAAGRPIGEDWGRPREPNT